MGIRDRLAHAWSVFRERPTDKLELYNQDLGPGNSWNMSRGVYRKRYNKNEFASTIFNKIALDASMVDLLHVKIDAKNGNQQEIKSGLNKIFKDEANIDQTSRAFVQDIIYSLLDEGVVAVVPIDTTKNPELTDSYDIGSMRVAKITQWYPKHVEIEAYNENTGLFERVIVSKKYTAIIENPLSAVTNEPNSTLQRLLSKMSLIDKYEEDAAQGKMNLAIQLPYALKTDAQRAQADKRIEGFQAQMKDNKYGIFYLDSTEKMTQLNREISSSVYEQIQKLEQEFYNQMGLTEKIFNGTADESETRNYYSRSIDPLVERIATEFKRKFLTATARSQGQTIVMYRDPFKLVPIDQIADIADKFSRNAILSSNEMRKIVGFRPSSDPEADKLVNRNIALRNQRGYGAYSEPEATGSLTSPDSIQNE